MSTHQTTEFAKEFPATIKGLEVCAHFGPWVLFGSRAIDRYVVVPEEKLAFVTDLTVRMNGTRSLADLASMIGKPGSQVNRVYRELCRAGLVVGSQPALILGRFALLLHKWPLPTAAKRLRDVISQSFLPLCILSAVAIVGGIAFAFLNPHVLQLSTPLTAAGGWRSLAQVVFLFAVAVSLHEIAHMIAAVRFGLAPQSLMLIAYLGVIPFLLLRIPGLYLLSARKRIVVWLAGVWCNLALWSVASMLGSVGVSATIREAFNRFAVTNLTLATLNVLPLLPTDGYFVMTTLLRQPNLRIRSQREAYRLFQGRKARSGMLVLYWCASVGFMLFLVSHNLHACYEIARGIGLWCFVVFGLVSAGLLAGKHAGVIGNDQEKR